jgi:hypothetical protein
MFLLHLTQKGPKSSRKKKIKTTGAESPQRKNIHEINKREEKHKRDNQ